MQLGLRQMDAGLCQAGKTILWRLELLSPNIKLMELGSITTLLQSIDINISVLLCYLVAEIHMLTESPNQYCESFQEILK